MVKSWARLAEEEGVEIVSPGRHEKEAQYLAFKEGEKGKTGQGPLGPFSKKKKNLGG